MDPRQRRFYCQRMKKRSIGVFQYLKFRIFKFVTNGINETGAYSKNLVGVTDFFSIRVVVILF